MNSLTDQQLLRDYASRQSESAFAELVRRHVDHVYSAALRMVCDAHLAQDVTQGAFVALAQNARRLADRPVLSGWLHLTARNLAANTVRSEVRRRTREQESVAMNQLLANESDAVWETLAPHLDPALGELNETERDAVMLRYFERKSAGEIAKILGTSEDAAQKRVSRAVEHLREGFSKRRLAIGAGGLVALISANAVQSAPAGLASAISTAAVLSGVAIQSSTLVATTKAITMTALQKSVIGVALVTVMSTGVYATYQNSRLRDQIQTIQQQQVSLNAQFVELQSERDDATNRLAGLLAEKAQLESNPNENEILKLRQKVAQLKKTAAQRENDPISSAAKAWLDSMKGLKDYVEKHPDEKIPEFQFIKDSDWLNAVDPWFVNADLPKDFYWKQAAGMLRGKAENAFGYLIEAALRKYASENNGQFPTDLSQLQPYCNPDMEKLLQQLYEIKPASILPPYTVRSLNVKTAWVITRKESVSRFSSIEAVWADGFASWQPPVSNGGPTAGK